MSSITRSFELNDFVECLDMCSAFHRAVLKVRVFLEETSIFEIRSVHHREVIIVYESDDVLDGTKISRLSSTAIHPQALPIQAKTHFLRHIFAVVEQPEVVLIISVAPINLERHASRIWNVRRLLEQPNSRQHILNRLIMRRVQDHLKLIAGNHFQHKVHDVPYEPVGSKQPLHDLKSIATLLHLEQIRVGQQSLNVTLLDAIVGRINRNRLLEIVVVIFGCRRVERLQIVQIDYVVAFRFVLRLSRRLVGISLARQLLIVT